MMCIHPLVALVAAAALSAARSGRAEAPFPEFYNPHPSSHLAGFGTHVVPLATGNVVVTAPGNDLAANNAGAVHLFDGRTGELISTITGSHVNDKIGSGQGSLILVP